MQFWYRTFFLKDSSQDAKLSISEEWIPIVSDCNFFLISPTYNLSQKDNFSAKYEN